MERPLFFYGTLRDRELLEAVLGHPVAPSDVSEARAPHYRTVVYPGRVYPGIIGAPGSAAEGTLVHDVTDFDRDVLDAFEGEEYERRPILVEVAGEIEEADVYWPTTDIPADAPGWTFADWERDHKSHVLVTDGLQARELRLLLMEAGTE